MKKRFPPPEDDKWDPYILGQPMGKVGVTIFLCIMIVIPIAIEMYIHYHPVSDTRVSGKHK